MKKKLAKAAKAQSKSTPRSDSPLVVAGISKGVATAKQDTKAPLLPNVAETGSFAQENESAAPSDKKASVDANPEADNEEDNPTSTAEIRARIAAEKEQRDALQAALDVTVSGN